MNSLNSQESSNDIGRLTDRQQAEYRNAYQEYIAQMSQLELGGAGGERPVQPQPAQFMTSSSEEDKNNDGVEADGRRALKKTNSKTENPDFSNSDGLDPITEEDERGDHGSTKSLLTRKTSGGGGGGSGGGLFQGAAELKLKAGGGGGGPRYQKLTSDDDESEESDNGPLKAVAAEGRAPPGGPPSALKGKDYLSDAVLDKKDSSDSGVRSSESSPNHSLQDEEADLSQLDRSNLIELDQEEGRAGKQQGGGSLPSSLSGLQDPAVARMSICSEDQCSLLASSPEESSWPSSRSFNLNRTPSNVTLNNNANRLRQPAEGSTSTCTSSPNNTTSTSSSTADIIISPTSSGSTTTRLGPNNENVRVVHLKRGLKPGDPPEVCTVSSDTVTFGEERESIL